MATVYLYGADQSDITAAFWVALALGIPVTQVTGDLSQATSWVSSSYPVLAVGNPALNNLLGQNANWVNFCNYGSWYSSPSQGPIDACGGTAKQSLDLAYALANNAVNGVALSGLPAQCGTCT